MDCPEFEAWSAYADGETAPAESRKLKEHLESCKGCSRKLRSLQAQKSSLASAAVPAMPADLSAKLRGLSDTMPREAAEEEVSSWTRWLGEIKAGLSRPASAFSLAAVVCLAFFLWAKNSGVFLPRLEVPVDLLIAAHNQYALTLPLAPAEKIIVEMPPVHMARAFTEGRNVQ